MSRAPIIMTANGWTPWVVKETSETEVMVPAKVSSTASKELRTSLIRLRPMTLAPLLLSIL